MDLQIYDDPRAFRALADPFYGSDTFRHTIALTVIARMLGVPRDEAPIMGTLHDNGELVGVALRTPPWPVIVSGLPTDPGLLDSFLTQWLDADPGLPGVSGPIENAQPVADAWIRHTGGSTKVRLASRLFRLRELLPPTTTGRARAATEDDIPLLVRWRLDFHRQAVHFQQLPDEGDGPVRRMFENGDSIVLWEDDGEPVAWALASAPIGGMSRIGPVYTPKEHREHGYGSAVTAAVARHAMNAGAHDVILFTDLTNPVSNSIYQKIGFRPVYDSTELEFARLPSTA